MNFSERTVPLDRRVRLVTSEIESNFSRTWSAEELAQLVNLSPSRLRDLFKAQTGEEDNYLSTKSVFAAHRRCC